VIGIKELTQRQREIYEFIKDFHDKMGYPPTIREISEHFGFSSPTGALVHVEAIEKKGYIKRDHASRGIKVVAKSPFDVTFAELIGKMDKSGKIVKSGEQTHIPVPSNEKQLLSVESLVDIPEFGIFKGDYVVFVPGRSSKGLVLLKKGEEHVVCILKKEKLENLTGEEINGFDLEFAFYGVLRIPGHDKKITG